MSFLDKFRGKGTEVKHKASELADEHNDAIDQGIDKAAELADKATGGKFSDKIDGVAEKAKDAADKLADDKP